MLTFELGVLSKGNITAIRKLSDIEYREYKKSADRLFDFSRDQQLYKIMRLNYDDLLGTLIAYSQAYAKNPRGVNWMAIENMVLNINRHLLNCLSTVRTFLDHTETNLKKRYGVQSGRFRRFKDACSKAYDGNFSYRFLMKLRNYSQHCGMPVGALKLHSKEEPPYSGQVFSSLEVKFSRDELLGFDLWGKQLIKEIQKLSSEFDIIPHVAEMMRCLERINLTLIEDDLPDLRLSAEYIERLINPAKTESGVPCILKIKKLDGIKKLEVQITNIPLHLVETIKNIKND